MLTTARGVTLGLGKIKLNDLKIDFRDRAGFLKRQQQTQRSVRQKIIIKRHLDAKQLEQLLLDESNRWLLIIIVALLLFAAPPAAGSSANVAVLATLWAACRAVAFGSVVIVTGVLMTIIGYFDLNLSEEVSQNLKTGETVISINWTKKYTLKSLQYLGPVLMGFGSFILIIACVITLEYRDKNAEILRPETGEVIKKPMLPDDQLKQHAPLTIEEICNWKPKFHRTSITEHLCSPLLNRHARYSSTSCIPQLLEFVDTRKLYERLVGTHCNEATRNRLPEELDSSGRHEHGRASTNPSRSVESGCLTRQSVVAEVHECPPISPDVITWATNGLGSSCSMTEDSYRHWSLDLSGDDSSSTYQWRPPADLHAPLAALDVEFRLSSGTPSPNTNRSDHDPQFTV